jgi:hypothetical protein
MEQWQGAKGVSYYGCGEDFGPCGCGKARATHGLELPRTWWEAEQEAYQAFLRAHDLAFFAGGYDYRSILGDGDEAIIQRSACAACARQAEELGLVVEDEDVSCT